MIISACLLYYFHIQTKRISSRISSLEGLQAPPTGGKWGLVLSTFFLSVIYLPLSTISVHAIVWSSDFWPNSAPRTSSVCFTTTLDPNEINFGPPIVILAILTVTFVSKSLICDILFTLFDLKFLFLSLLFGSLFG